MDNDKTTPTAFRKSDAQLTAIEQRAAFAASKAYLDANVPGFERIMITDEMIQGQANAIVVAVDRARAAA